MNCPECHATLPADAVAGLCPRCVAKSLAQSWDVLMQPVEVKADGEKPVVPGWELLEPVGAGGQGIVWRAARLEEDELGAVKVFRGREVENAARMEAEAAALRALEHAGIVRVLDSGTAPDGSFFIVTEFIEGCDLQRLMQAQRLTADRALEIAARVTEAVGHAHERGLVHRDLKPANVLIARDGAVKLADFSLARDLDSAKKITMTREGMTFGTPYYLAPEVMRGEPAEVTADLYAIGVMLYEMLTGAPPAGRFSRVSEKGDLPREVDRLIESLLAEEPSKRPASAKEVLEKLSKIDALRRGELAARLRKHRWKLVGGIAAGLVLAGVIGYSIPREPPPPPAPPKLNAKGFPNPAAATRAEPWKNSLEMSFIPVPDLRGLLVARHETRMGDYMRYVHDLETSEDWRKAYGAEQSTRIHITDVRPNGWQSLPSLPFNLDMLVVTKLSPDSAACGVNYFQASRFCAWLTWREQRDGRIAPGEYYRLPTDEEWSLAAGLPAETEPDVEKRHLSLPKGAAFPWGKGWPAPRHFANYAGQEARDAQWPSAWLSLPEANDDYPRVSPVGGFAESKTGLFDLWGNVWEWCDTKRNLVSNQMILRGGSWVDGGYPGQLRTDFRRFERPNLRETCMGFRCVLVVPELPQMKNSAAR